MADTQTDIGSGLSQFWHYTDPVPPENHGVFTDLEAQTDLYLAAVKGKLPVNDFFDTTTYQSTKKVTGINNQTAEKDFFTSDGTYQAELQKDGSAIINVDGTQVGNQAVAQVLDYKSYDEYYNRGK